MGARPDGWWRDRQAAQRRLVDRLEAFADARDEPVTVIFDGQPHDAGGGLRVSVRFARRSSYSWMRGGPSSTSVRMSHSAAALASNSMDAGRPGSAMIAWSATASR